MTMSEDNTDVIVATLPVRNVASTNRDVTLAEASRDLPSTFSTALNPVGPVERFLVEEIARRATDTRDYHAAIDSLRRDGEAAYLSVLSPPDGKVASAHNLARASVLGSERHESLMRQGLASTRGFFRALDALREVRAPVHELGSSSLPVRDPRFATEQACAVYLVRRYVHGTSICRRCGKAAMGSFVAARSCWQCAGCRTQTGLRYGTCMERSPLPLTQWFAAIRIVLLYPTIPTEELAAALNVGRRQTVRNVIRRIRAAVSAPDPSAALAGLDELYLGLG
jgi:hypothetical protein